jgi:hypothetical protein
MNNYNANSRRYNNSVRNVYHTSISLNGSLKAWFEFDSPYWHTTDVYERTVSYGQSVQEN